MEDLEKFNLNNDIQQRSGTVDLGRKYEVHLAALIALRCTLDDTIEDFTLLSNVKNYGDFDDVVLGVSFKDTSRQKYLMQLKHKNNTSASVYTKMLIQENGDFSIKKYEKSYYDIIQKFDDTENMKYILYTNAGFTPNETKSPIEFKPVTPQKFGFLNTSCSDSNMWQMRNVSNDTSQYNPEFLENFYFFAKQIYADDIKPLIIEILKEKLGDIDETTVVLILDFFQDWATGTYIKHYELQKADVEMKLTEFIYHAFRIPLEENNLPNEECYKLWNDVISNYDVTCVPHNKAMESKIAQATSWKIQNSEAWSLYKNNKLYDNENYKRKIMRRKRASIKNVQFDDLYLALWESLQVPLIITCRDDTQFETIIKTLTTFNSIIRKFIIFSKSTRDPDIGSYRVFRNLATFDMDELQMDYILQRFTFSLQGKPFTSHQLLHSKNKNLLELITPEIFFEIAFHKMKIGNEITDDKYIINRYFQKIIVKPDILGEQSEECFIIAKEEDRQHFLPLLYLYSKVRKIPGMRVSFPSETGITEECIEKIFKNIQHDKSGHIFLWKSNYLYSGFPVLEWIYSNKNSGYVSKYSINDIRFSSDSDESSTKHFFIEANQALSYYKYLNVTILSNNSGSGKTVTLRHLASTCPPNLWVVFINLSKHSKSIKKKIRQNSDIVELVMPFFGLQKMKKKTENFICELFKDKMKNKEVLFLIDGYEFSESKADSLLDLLNRQNCKIWVTTRSFKKTQLERKYNTISVQLAAFSIDDARNLLCKNLSKKDPNLLKENEQTIENILNVPTKELLGTPLYINMVADVIQQNRTENLDKMTLVDLYGKFISSKIEMRDLIILRQLALTLFFSENDLKDIINWEEFCIHKKDLENRKDKNFILEGFSSGKPYFVHHTYAEYLSATYLIDNIEWMHRNHKNTFKRLLEQLYHSDKLNIRYFFDLLLFKDLPLHEAILEEDLPKIELLLDLDKKKEVLQQRDQCGRTILHVAASYGKFLLFHKTNKSKELLNNADVNVTIPLLSDVRCQGEVIFKFLLEKIACTESKDLLFNAEDKFGFTISTIAYETGCLINLNNFFSYENIERIPYNWPDITFIYHCLQNGLNNLLELTEFDCFCHIRCNNEYLLNTALKYCNLNIIKKIITKTSDCELRKNESLQELVNKYDLLNSVCTRSDDYVENLISLLIDNGARVIWDASKSSSPLHIAARMGNIKCLRILLHKKFSIKATDHYQRTALHIACYSRKLSCVMELLQNKIKVNATDHMVNTPLHYAAMVGDTDCIKELIKYKADINKANRNGDTPLIVAAIHGQATCLLELLNYGALINKKNKNGHTAFLAVINGINKNFGRQSISDGTEISMDVTLFPPTSAILETLDILLSKGIFIDERDKDGNTAYMLAVKKGNLEVANYLIERGASIHETNKSGATALTFAIERNETQYAIRLMSMGISLKGCDQFGNTNLMVALNNENKEIITELLKRDVPVMETNHNEETCLILAIQGGLDEFIPTLIQRGVSVKHVDKTGNNALMWSIIFDRKQSFYELVKRPKISETINIYNESHDTCLLLAVRFGFQAAIPVLLERGAKVDVTDSGGNSALILAVMRNMQECISELLDSGAPVDMENKKGYTALMVAAANDNIEIIKMLLQAGASVDWKNKQSNTILMIAAENGKKEVIELLLQAGASVDLKNENGNTALMIATWHGNQEAIEALLRAGASKHFQNQVGTTALLVAVKKNNREISEILLQGDISIDLHDQQGWTALMHAAQNGNQEIIHMLLQAGASVDFQNKVGATALMIAVAKGMQQAVGLLLQAGASVDFRISIGATALMTAAEQGNREITKMLLQAGASVDLTDQQGWTALMYAARNDSREDIEMLLQAGASIDFQNKAGNTALMIAVQHGKQQAVELLLQAGASIDFKTLIGETALMIAAEQGNRDITKMLLQAGASVDLTDQQGWTALMYAARNDSREAIEMLLQAGASVDVKNQQGCTALKIAASKGYREITEMLLEVVKRHRNEKARNTA